ncbi:hypothetical protein NMG60_11014892 [Bertholletia excelsa]
MSSPFLLPGFRFHPTDEELIIHYLRKKVSFPSAPFLSIIADIDLYKFNPWDLPAKAMFGDNEWFFFTPRDRKYPNGARPNRTAGSGYWKATGTDKPILSTGGLQCLGVKKALVFYEGRPPKGLKTDWVMHEYRLIDDSRSTTRLRGSMRLDDWVLCRVRQKSNLPQQVGENPDNRSPSFIPPLDSNILAEMMMRKKNHSQDAAFDLQSYLEYPVDQVSDLERKSSPLENLNFKAAAAPSKPSSTEVATSFKNGFKRTISVASFGEDLQFSPCKKPHTAAFGDMEDTSIFEICYLASSDSSSPSTSLAGYSECLSS